MIQIKKSLEPTVLVENWQAWTEEFVKYKTAVEKLPDAVRYRYRHKEIKKAICAEAHDKCAYCESKITHVSPGDVEHILPSSKCPTLAFKWSNLILSCTECNRRKLDYCDLAEPLIDPVEDQPSSHIRFLGPLAFAVPGRVSKRAETR